MILFFAADVAMRPDTGGKKAGSRLFAGVQKGGIHGLIRPVYWQAGCMNSKQTSWVAGIRAILVGLAFFVPYAAAQQTQAQPAAPAQAQPAAPAAAPAQPASPAAAPAPAPNPNQAQAQAQQAAAGTAPEEKKDEDETVFDNGVRMKILRAGKGPKPAPNAIVQIQYIGSLEDGTEFDRSYSRRYPSIYKLSDVIGCWQTGIPEMQVGSKARFTCPPGSANGKRPVDFIRGDTTLYFVIELIAITG